MKKGTLTKKKIAKLFKEADIVWQDQKDENIFYLANERDFYFSNGEDGDICIGSWWFCFVEKLKKVFRLSL